MEVASVGHLPMLQPSKGCLERALQLGAFPGTQEPSREQCKENLSIPQPSTVPPGLCVIYELRIN